MKTTKKRMVENMSKLKIAIINGPNINTLGKREGSVYGTVCWSEIENRLKALGMQLDVELMFFQSNHEGDIVDFIQCNMDELGGVIINPAAFSKVGYSILDALNSKSTPFVEVHLTNIVSRGGWHSESIFTEGAIGMVMGFKGFVYDMGLNAMYNYLKENLV